MTLLSAPYFSDRSKKNLGTFNNHFLTADAKKIFQQYATCNAADVFAYPEMIMVKKTCGEFLLTLCGATDLDQFQYHATSGSSEAVFLALAIFKKYFLTRCENKTRCNVIVATNAHSCWKKSADLLDIELREIPVDEKTRLLPVEKIENYIDNHTIGICATLGAPTTLLFDPVAALNDILVAYYERTHHFVPIHVDAASGGFVAPFQFSTLCWDFRLSHVNSINISSHKYGMVYPTLAWLLIRNLSCLSDLLHQNDYVGQMVSHLSLQFSHSAAPVVTQYYQIKTLGFVGYQKAVAHLFFLEKRLKNALKRFDTLQLIETTDVSHLPGVVFTIKSDFRLVDLANQLKNKGWYLPVYRLPAPHQQCEVARIVIRHGFSWQDIQQLLVDMETILSHLTLSLIS